MICSMSSWTCSRTSLIGGWCRLCFASSVNGMMLKPRGNFAEYLQVSWVPVADVSMLIRHLCYHHIIALIFVCSGWSTVTYLTVFKTSTALMLIVLCHYMVAVYCWFQRFCCLVTTEKVTFLWFVKAPNLIRCLLNVDTDSYYNLLGYDTMWSGGGSQYFGGTYCLHLQGRSQPRYWKHPL